MACEKRKRLTLNPLTQQGQSSFLCQQGGGALIVDSFLALGFAAAQIAADLRGLTNNKPGVLTGETNWVRSPKLTTTLLLSSPARWRRPHRRITPRARLLLRLNPRVNRIDIYI